MSPELLEAVLTKLGFASPPSPDREGLAALYLAWCRRVPFDNVRKLIALSDPDAVAGAPLPGGTADDFFPAFVAHGTGGTCWPSANALHELLIACGFDSRRIAASMFEMGEPSHGSTVVTFAAQGREQLLVDTSMLTNEPLPLRSEPTATRHPVFGTKIEPVPEGWRFEFPQFAADIVPCRTISPDAVELPFFLQRYEVSRGWSPFNAEVHARRNVGDTIVGYNAGQRGRRSADGVELADLRDAALHDALIEELTMSEEIVDRLFSVWTSSLPPPS